MDHKKNRVLITTQFYPPAYKAGGPVKSVFNMVEKIKLKYNIDIICSSKDLGSKSNFLCVKSDEWLVINKTKVFYASNLWITMKELIKLRFKMSYNIIYIPSFFNPIYSLLVLILFIGSKSKIIIAPKGEFFEGALKHKKIKKKIILKLFNFIFFLLKVKWHATNNQEKKSINSLFKKHNFTVNVMSNIVSKNSSIKFSHNKKKPGSLKIVMVGRISPVKNILLAISLVSKLEGDISLDIWGQIDDQLYWSECKKEITKLSKNINFKYNGCFDPKEIENIFLKYDLMLHTSWSENFGYAIYESLELGIPVVIGKQTPWKNLKKHKVGFDLSLEETDKFINVLNYYKNLDEDDLARIRKSCKAYANKYSKNLDVELQKTLFEEIFC